MVKNALIAISVVVSLASCSSLKPLNFTSSKAAPAAVNPPGQNNSNVKFIEDIAATPEISSKGKTEEVKETVTTRGFSVEETAPKNETTINSNSNAVIESASYLQLKYAVLLNTEVEQLQNKILLEGIDEWYGTRYRMGGTTKDGVDCSAFVGAVFMSVYAITLPRTAAEQYKATHRISRAELKEGDLLFFNTRGGVSHVGIYLRNNKFVHASTSKGVTISDIFEPYYIRRFIGAGRIDNKQEPIASY